VHLHLVSNPSHLEAVDPVAVGRVRAKQQRLVLEGAVRPEDRFASVVPIVLHGDAAFAGQGIVAETLNLQSVPGYEVGGTVHVVVNNLIGFTTEPYQLHSSRFATDVARRLPIPIFHINGEDPDAVVRVAALAMDYRARFHTDVVIDLIGYRRHGHNEADDPTTRQPLLYQRIKEHPVLWQSYARRIGVPQEEAQARVEAIKDEMSTHHREASQMKDLPEKPRLAKLPAYWAPFFGGLYKREYEVTTGLPAEEITSLARELVQVPEGFHVHPKLRKLLDERLEMGEGQRPIDYGMAETLALASLLRQGVPVRLTGQDTRRGTFAQRYAVLVDVENGREHLPLAGLARGKAFFEVYDSVLSEQAVLGYEYGFSRDYPEALVCWEAQFGDFVNGAQIIIDQFVTAGEDKWRLLSGVVLLLPHGYEGQGPEHSSARLERFLQLAGEDNIQVCQPSTAAQYFHLLRRQALRSWRKPLVVLTPKSMLRHKDSASSLQDLAQERFLGLVPDPEATRARKVIFCSGKVGHELRRERAKRGDSGIAILFLDQLYPFPEEEVKEALARYPEARTVMWVQEEPGNMGGLFYLRWHFERLARGRFFRSVRRTASGSPATGSQGAHQREQEVLLSLALEL
jgi:2-oxoglutarate dehydrogenase E1 component